MHHQKEYLEKDGYLAVLNYAAEGIAPGFQGSP